MSPEVIGQFIAFYVGLISLGLLAELGRAFLWATMFYWMFKRLRREDE